ncbi:hypothetical protein MRX96_055489, partial [Rhipicephalus microplus]
MRRVIKMGCKDQLDSARAQANNHRLGHCTTQYSNSSSTKGRDSSCQKVWYAQADRMGGWPHLSLGTCQADTRAQALPHYERTCAANTTHSSSSSFCEMGGATAGFDTRRQQRTTRSAEWQRMCGAFDERGSRTSSVGARIKAAAICETLVRVTNTDPISPN